MFKILKFKESNEVRHYRSSAEALAADCKFNGIDMEEFDLVETEAEPVPGWDGRMYLTREDIPAEQAKEIVRLQRAERYAAEVDVVTAQIQRLRDEPPSAAVEREIAALIAERSARVEKIKKDLPYAAEANEGGKIAV